MKRIHSPREILIEELVKNGTLKSPQIIHAFKRIDRRNFVQKELADVAYMDTALPIGFLQTISQPSVVAFMLELLNPKKGERIMDVGHGSGWQTALLAEIVGDTGKVFAIELVPQLCAFGRGNVLLHPEFSKRVEFYCQNASPGLPKEAQAAGGFDGIVAAAAVLKVPEAWRAQLKIGGRLVYPKGESIFKEVKKSYSAFEVNEYRGFVFVPFVD